MVSVALVLIQAALLLLLLGSGLGIGPYITSSDTWLLWGVIQPLRFSFVMGLLRECLSQHLLSALDILRIWVLYLHEI